MAAFPQIWTLYLLDLVLSIWPRYCLKASLFLLRAELYSTCSSSHGFHSSATNGATAPPSLTRPANTHNTQVLFSLTAHIYIIRIEKRNQPLTTNSCQLKVVLSEITQRCSRLFLHHPVNARDDF